MLKENGTGQSASSRSEADAASSVKRPGSQPKKSGWKLVLAASGALILAGALWSVRNHQRASAAQQAGAGRAAPVTVPVVAGVVARKDVPLYLDGLGTVQAFNTVTIRARVDGQLQKVGFIEGQDVRTGDLLAQIDPEPFRAQVEQNDARKRQDEAQLANARIQLRRDAELLDQKILAQQDYDAQKALADQLDAAVKADQAAIESARIQLGYTTIVSPIDGRTGMRLVDVGNVIRANDTNGLVVITQLRPISVVFTLPEQTLGEIHKQMSGGDLTVLAVDRNNSTVLGEGKLAVIDNQIDTSTGTIKLKATFANDDLRLWPGQFVNTRLLVTTRKGGAVVPASVVQRGPAGAYAFVIKDDQTVQMRPVEVERIEGGEALIRGGLQPGEHVVVDGQYKLQPGSRVKASQSASAEEEGDPEY